MSKTPHTDQKYIDALLNNDSRLIEEIYEKWHKEVLNFVRKNNGNEQDAGDLFQDALMAVVRRARKGDFVLTVPFGGYFYFVYKSKWLDKLRQKDREKVIINGEGRYKEEQDPSDYEPGTDEKRYELIDRCFMQLSEKCQELLRLTFLKLSRREIMERLKFGSENYTNKRVHECRGNLHKIVKKYPEYDELKELKYPN